MRQIATFPPENQTEAQLFADYLLSLSVETRLDNTPEGIILWVCDEDKVDLAREEQQSFQQNPHEGRYKKAAAEARSARAARKREEERLQRKEEELHRRIHLMPQRRWTLGLIAASIVATLLVHDRQMGSFGQKYLFIAPIEFSGNGYSYQSVKTSSDVLKEFRHGQLWRIVTPSFLHFGPWHLFFNLMWLLNLGTQIETRAGWKKLLGLVFTIAIISNLAQYFLSSIYFQNGSLQIESYRPGFGGMSGVVFGLFGYVWMKVKFQPSLGYMLTGFIIVMMIIWLYLCMTGLVGAVANTAHVAGLLVGLIWGYYGAWWSGEAQARG